MGKSKKHEKKSKKKHAHNKEHKEKKKLKKFKKSKREKSCDEPKNVVAEIPEKPENFAIPIELMNNKSHAPETPLEYQKRQSRIRREVDPVTGRTRLIKGDSEVLEEIVTRERHTDINKSATHGDGRFFQKTVGAAANQKRK